MNDEANVSKNGTTGRPPDGSSSEGSPRAWRVVGRRRGEPMPLFRPRYDRVQSPRNGREFERLVLETADWVNVVALTDSLEAVMVRQYRFGSDRVALEVPGGVLDDGEQPEQAGRRELLEETGYESDDWRLLAVVRPNPAFLDNVCYHYLAQRARKVAEPRPDEGEDIAVELVPVEDLAAMLRAGNIDHALVVSALVRVLDARSFDLAALRQGRPTADRG